MQQRHEAASLLLVSMESLARSRNGVESVLHKAIFPWRAGISLVPLLVKVFLG